jgi:DNA-directed RNA polymerase specialized sigma24 family protein
MEGSRTGIEALLAERAWLHRLARALAAPADADDLEQEVWARVLHRPPAHASDAGAGLRGWLRRVARSVLVDARRAATRTFSLCRNQSRAPRENKSYQRPACGDSGLSLSSDIFTSSQP